MITRSASGHCRGRFPKWPFFDVRNVRGFPNPPPNRHFERNKPMLFLSDSLLRISWLVEREISLRFLIEAMPFNLEFIAVSSFIS
jgi:hypothetical protein